MTSARILADSLSEAGYRLTTMEVTFPRIILPELLTHRMFSRNSASSRAIPVEQMIERVRENPYVPKVWTSAQKGMQGGEPLTGVDAVWAEKRWRDALHSSLAVAEDLSRCGVHKQHVNRLLEPFAWHTVIVSATEWDNFLQLRMAADAQPEMQTLAGRMRDALTYSRPEMLYPGEWHMPFIRTEDGPIPTMDKVKLSVARCARVSYLTHDGRRDPEADLALYDRLLKSGHLSPFEHVATPMSRAHIDQEGEWSGNFRGFHQWRKLVDLVTP